MNEQPQRSKRAVLFLTWGEKVAEQPDAVLRNSKLDGYDCYHIADVHPAGLSEHLQPLSAEYNHRTGCLPKVQMVRHIPEGYDSYLYLDTDVRVLDSVDAGFEAAEKHGLAMTPMGAYSTESRQRFGQCLEDHGLPNLDPVIFNCGVIFFSLTPAVRTLFDTWLDLAERSPNPYTDQMLLNLAMTQQDVVPYPLSSNYNFRAFDDYVVGPVRIWHSHAEVPKGINEDPWVRGRRKVTLGRMETPWRRRGGLGALLHRVLNWPARQRRKKFMERA